MTGARVALRRLRPDDLVAFQAYRRDPELGRYQGWSAQSDADARAFIDEMAAAPLFARGEWVQLAIAEQSTDALVGDIGVHLDTEGRTAEVGFTLSRAAQGRGFAAEAVALVLGLLWQQGGVERVVGVTDTRNAPSVRLLERLGFRLDHTRETRFKGEACVEAVYRLERPAGG